MGKDERWLIVPRDLMLSSTAKAEPVLWQYWRFFTETVLDQDARFSKGAGIRAGARLAHVLLDAGAGALLCFRTEDFKLLCDAMNDPQFVGGGGYVPRVARTILEDWIDYSRESATRTAPASEILVES